MAGPTSPTGSSANIPPSAHMPEMEPENHQQTEKNIPPHDHHSPEPADKNLDDRTKAPLNGQSLDPTQRAGTPPPAAPTPSKNYFKEIPESLLPEAQHLVNEKLKYLGFQNQLELSSAAANALGECLQQLKNNPEGFLNWVDSAPEVDFYVTFKASKNEGAFQLYPLKNEAKQLFKDNRQLLMNQLELAVQTMQQWKPSSANLIFDKAVLSRKNEELKKSFTELDNKVEQYRRDNEIKGNFRRLNEIYSDVLFDENERKVRDKEETHVQAAMDGQAVINAYTQAGAKKP